MYPLSLRVPLTLFTFDSCLLTKFGKGMQARSVCRSTLVATSFSGGRYLRFMLSGWSVSAIKVLGMLIRIGRRMVVKLYYLKSSGSTAVIVHEYYKQ